MPTTTSLSTPTSRRLPEVLTLEPAAPSALRADNIGTFTLAGGDWTQVSAICRPSMQLISALVVGRSCGDRRAQYDLLQSDSRRRGIGGGKYENPQRLHCLNVTGGATLDRLHAGEQRSRTCPSSAPSHELLAAPTRSRQRHQRRQHGPDRQRRNDPFTGAVRRPGPYDQQCRDRTRPPRVVGQYRPVRRDRQLPASSAISISPGFTGQREPERDWTLVSSSECSPARTPAPSATST